MKNLEDKEDPYVLYLVVRESLNMSTGKIAAQCGHAVEMICKTYTILFSKMISGAFNLLEEEKNKLDIFAAYEQGAHRKVVLRADDKEWERLKKELNCYKVIDAGFTEIEPHSETVIGLFPMKKSERPAILKRLQVL